MTTTVIVPTFNEGGNIRQLVTRLAAALDGQPAEILFVDDSDDDTPVIITEVSEWAPISCRLVHRDIPTGGLAGAVTEGIALAQGDNIVVMDGDLQHPPELVPKLISQLDTADLVVASRYGGEGEASGLSSSWRMTVSRCSTVLAQTCFPRRVGRVCSDPMTGFFAFRADAVDLDRLRPRGFKILLEILARHDLAVAEIPFVFGKRNDGESKASWKNGVAFLYQLMALRMGKMSRFAAVGALGTVANLAILWALIQMGVHYLPAAVIAAEVSIAQNFLMQERFVYRDEIPLSQHGWLRRASTFLAFNNVETLVRLPVLAALVTGLGVNPVPAQAATLLAAFLIRFTFVTKIIYRFKPADDRTRQTTGATA